MNYSLFFRLPLLACSFLIFVVSIAQNSETIESQNLSDQFDLLIQNSETYDNYKVIKQDKLNAFRSTMIDSLRSFTISSQEAKTKIESQNTNIEKLNSIINEKEILMAENEKERNGISVLGIQLDKTTYSIISVVIPIFLLGVIGALFFKLQSNNKQTNEAQEHVLKLEKEYEEHKKRTLDNQMKLKRELQTERNKLSELTK